ncbi:outer membrane lipoprotein carrier protein LolA [Candidatus Binatia bacterium]|nr:outer membrane lipoprotein carrier protein LolA [Candidatus Binatia bacterium]
MTRICAGSLATLLLATVAAAAGPDADSVVRKVQQRYDETRDFTADVVQATTVASLGKTVTAEGTMVFKKPGRMRFELGGDAAQIMVADGTTLWLYQPEERQVLKTPFDAAFRATTPVSFLTGVGRIADNFSASLAPPDAAENALVLDLTPRKANGGVGKLRLYVARDNYDIRGAEVHDPQGNVSRLTFTRMRRNVGVDDDRFVFQVPPGVDVVTAPLPE